MFNGYFYSNFRTKLSQIMKTRLLLAKQTQVLLLESEKVREGPREGHRRTKAVYAHVSNPPH